MTSKEIKDKIIEEISIVDVVSEYVQLEKSGNSLKGLCPFHDDSTPSFHVSPEKKICKCFSCGEGGDVIYFYSKINNLSYNEAQTALGKRIGIEIKRDEYQERLEHLYSINFKTEAFYQFCLKNTELGSKALEYLNNRQIDEKLINIFKIGLAPKDYNSLYKYLLSKNYNEIDLLELGLIRSKDDRYFDVFNSRIMFPICNENHKIVGFSGRVFQGEKNTGKYINSMETTLFKKSEILYNLNNAKDHIKKKKRVFILEGFMDVIACYKAELFETICTMGTALTNQHVKLLKKYTDNVVLCFDGDEAGKKATIHAIQVLKEHNFSISVITLPDNLDPDEFQIKYGKEKFIDYMNNNILDEISFQYNLLKQELNINNLNSIEKFTQNAFTYVLNNVKSASLKDKFLTLIAQDTLIDKEQIVNDYNQFLKFKISFNNPKITIKEPQKIKVDKYFNAERYLIKYMIKDKRYVSIINERLKGFITSNDILFELRDFIEIYYIENDVFSEECFMAYLDDDKIKFYEEYIRELKVNYSDKALLEYIKTFNEYNEYLKVTNLTDSIKDATDDQERLKLLEILRQKKKGGKQ